ncbi:acyl-CoA reductase [Bosea sp. CER48]|uniref:acyl-CoA reductase n=1 Tax=Bosea sp. CER48 TaxID=3377035 RepID=UPI0037F56618
MIEHAGHLPGLNAKALRWREVSLSAWGESATIALPELDGAQAAALCAQVRDNAGARLKQMPVARIVDAIDAAIMRLLDRGDPLRRKAEHLLPIVTGYDRETVRLGLTGYLKTFRRPQLLRFLAEDFANPGVLDGFRPTPKGGYLRAHGPELLLHVWAGNVPALSLWSLICGLLVKAGNIGKLASAEPLTAGWFAGLLSEIDPEIGECLAITWWKGGEAAAEPTFLREADTVIAYGGNETLTALRARLPVTTRFLPHGHKIGFGVVAREALDSRKAPALARLAAHDVVRYEQQGCYSPQMLFVERGGRVEAAEFARYVAQELGTLASRHPRRALSPGEAASIATWRGAQETRAMEGAAELLGEPSDSWSVVHVAAAEPLSPTGLNRSLKLVAVESLDDIPALIAPYRSFLQTAGVAAAPERLFRLSEQLGKAGISRIAPLGRMTAPEAGWHHDGRFSLLDLVTLTEIEQAAEAAAEGFAPYVD